MRTDPPIRRGVRDKGDGVAVRPSSRKTRQSVPIGPLCQRIAADQVRLIFHRPASAWQFRRRRRGFADRSLLLSPPPKVGVTGDRPFPAPIRTMSANRSTAALLAITLASAGGCAGRQYGRLLASDDSDLVGSHAAGSATWNPLVDQGRRGIAVAMPAGPRRCKPFRTRSVATPARPHRRYAWRLSEWKIAAARNWLRFSKTNCSKTIDAKVNGSSGYRGISSRMVDAALRETRLRPDSLFLPANRDAFSAVLGRNGSPVDYLLHATITSGTTDRNKTTQRDYTLTLEMVNVHTGDFIKEQAKIRKGYAGTRGGHWWNWGPLNQADG